MSEAPPEDQKQRLARELNALFDAVTNDPATAITRIELRAYDAVTRLESPVTELSERDLSGENVVDKIVRRILKNIETDAAYVPGEAVYVVATFRGGVSRMAPISRIFLKVEGGQQLTPASSASALALRTPSQLARSASILDPEEAVKFYAQGFEHFRLTNEAIDKKLDFVIKAYKELADAQGKAIQRNEEVMESRGKRDISVLEIYERMVLNEDERERKKRREAILEEGMKKTAAMLGPGLMTLASMFTEKNFGMKLFPAVPVTTSEPAKSNGTATKTEEAKKVDKVEEKPEAPLDVRFVHARVAMATRTLFTTLAASGKLDALRAMIASMPFAEHFAAIEKDEKTTPAPDVDERLALASMHLFGSLISDKTLAAAIDAASSDYEKIQFQEWGRACATLIEAMTPDVKSDTKSEGEKKS